VNNIVIEIKAPELTQAILALAEVMSKALTVRISSKVAEAYPDNTPEPDPEPAQQAEAPGKVITLEEVRAKLAELSRTGKREQVKGLLSRYGVDKLTEVPTDRYSELLDLAEAI
jgi:hypothetical protein